MNFILKYVNGTVVRELKGHRLTVTCVAVSNNGKYLFSGSKDGSIIKCNSIIINY
jgi:ribosomal RNA-processing protein 9